MCGTTLNYTMLEEFTPTFRGVSPQQLQGAEEKGNAKTRREI
jgi:hypothetical protein